jgi:hypothetical protein
MFKKAVNGSLTALATNPFCMHRAKLLPKVTNLIRLELGAVCVL